MVEQQHKEIPIILKMAIILFFLRNLEGLQQQAEQALTKQREEIMDKQLAKRVFQHL